MNCSSSSCILDYVLPFCLAIATLLAATSCTPRSLGVGPQLGGLAALPDSLTSAPLTLSRILQVRDNLSNIQLNSALRQLLDHGTTSDDDRREASYVLARLLQSGTNPVDLKESLGYFDTSKALPALHQLSLWHISEVATSLGQEKLVRKTLQSIMSETDSEDKRQAAEYCLAQSYLRSGENDKAEAVFRKIKKDYPETEYALGANYYLGEMAISRYKPSGPDSKSTQNPNDRNSATESLKEGISLFNQYLRSSATGHFAHTILDRLRPLIKSDPSAFAKSDLDLYGRAAYAQGNWMGALDFWQQGECSRVMESAMCLAKVGSLDRARVTLLAAIKRNPEDYRYVSVVNEIANRLRSADALKLWRQVLASKPQNCDAALWNIAKRAPPPESLLNYHDLLNRYPHSAYAPESQWWLFWDMVQHKKGKDLLTLVSIADSAAQRYRSAHAAPRFLFWAGKICQRAGSEKQAESFYTKTHRLYPTDYYGYRSLAHLSALHKTICLYGFGKRLPNPKLANWNWPLPQAVSDRTDKVASVPFWELVRLKEYQEALALVPEHNPELAAWLYTRLDQPRQTITEASAHLPSGPPTSDPIWQYSYPLLYGQQIQANCRVKKNVDTFLVHALVREESYYNRFAVSSSNAIGLTQVMPGTAYGVAKQLHVPIQNTTAIFDPILNLQLGISYFSLCLSRFHDNPVLAVASYNGGAGAVRSWLNKPGLDDPDAFVENIPFRETREYVRKVLRSYWIYCAIYQKV